MLLRRKQRHTCHPQPIIFAKTAWKWNFVQPSNKILNHCVLRSIKCDCLCSLSKMYKQFPSISFCNLGRQQNPETKTSIIRTDGWVRILKPVNDSELFYIFVWCQILHSETHSLDTFFQRSSCILIFAEYCMPQKRVISINTYTKIGLVRNDKLSYTGCGRIVFLIEKIISEYPRCTWGKHIYFALCFVKWSLSSSTRRYQSLPSFYQMLNNSQIF